MTKYLKDATPNNVIENYSYEDAHNKLDWITVALSTVKDANVDKIFKRGCIQLLMELKDACLIQYLKESEIEK